MKNNRLLFVFILAFPLTLFGQHTYLPINPFTNHILDRFEIKNDSIAGDYYHTGNKSYRRKSIADFANKKDSSNISFSKQDKFNLAYLLNDNFEWANNDLTKSKNQNLKGFYKQKSALYSVQIPDFNLVINPVLDYQMSTIDYMGTRGLINNRGIEIRGNITDKIGFYSQVSDEIYRPTPAAIEEYKRIGTLQGIGFTKSDGKEFNHFLSSGYISFSPNKYMDWQLGQGRQFIGDGVRTFIMSNNAVDNFYLRLNTRIWKINYTNIFSEYRDYNVKGYGIQARHYAATHHLSVNIGKRFNLGLFETIIFQRDSGYNNGGFEVNYLNPIIMYKSIENGLNSTDKAILGANFKFNFLNRFSLYGQLVISEFVLDQITMNKGWWGNKWAYQLGLKYIDVFGVNNLDAQVEYNVCRPFMYTSYSPLQTFTNYAQPLGHPLGANFRELIGVVRYQPLNKLYLQLKGIYYEIGYDTNNSNVGQNIGLSYNTRTLGEYGNTIAQGQLTKVLYIDFMSSYMIKHNLFIDAGVTYRYSNSAIAAYQSENTYFTLGIRLNITRKEFDR
ncbi:MAG: hypothetical protein V4538_00475 [Bacteroidota bacterium]